MATINYFLRGKSNPTKIYIRLKHGIDYDLKTTTNYYINSDDWSKVKGQPKNQKTENNKVISFGLEELKTKIFESINNLSPDEQPTLDWLKNIINPPKEEEKEEEISNSLLKMFDLFIEVKKDTSSHSSIKKYTTYKHLLARFEEFKEKEVLISDVDLNFKKEITEYCKENNYAINTIARFIKQIKSVCFFAENYGISLNPQIRKISVKPEKVKHIYLTLDELKKIKQCSLSNYLDNARDWLIISCFTGQRVSDFLKFDSSMIREENGSRFLEFTQQKTGKLMSIPLHPEVEEILKKRNGQFPRTISDQRYNEYIKEVCKKAEINNVVTGSKNNPETNRKITGNFEKWELVTSHIGRRSLATNFYGSVPTSILKSITGHSSEQQFLRYIGKAENEQSKQIANYW